MLLLLFNIHSLCFLFSLNVIFFAITAPSGPPSVTLKKLGIFSQSLEATWDNVSGFNIEYEIRLISANKSLNNSSETTNSYTYHHLDQLTTYQVYVRAVVSNSSAKSEEVPSNQVKTGKKTNRQKKACSSMNKTNTFSVL